MERKTDNIYIYLWEEFNTVYVGRTKNPKSRHYQHRHNVTEATYKFSSEHHVEHPKMIIIENDLSIEEGVEREIYWINHYIENTSYNVLNKSRGGQIGRLSIYTEEERKKHKKQYIIDHKDEIKAKSQEYYRKHREEKLIKAKKYREEHHDEIREREKEAYEEKTKQQRKSREIVKKILKVEKEILKENQEKRNAIKKELRKIQNAEKNKEYCRIYYQNHKEIMCEQIKRSQQNYYKTNRDRIIEYQKKYNDTHKEEKKIYNKTYYRLKKENIKNVK